MRTTEDDSSLREAFAVEPGGPAPERCPPPDRIYGAVRGELPADEIRDLVDHLADCPHCAEAWRLAVAFEEEAAAEGEARALGGRAAHPARSAWWPAAAAVLVAALAAGVWWSLGPGAGPGDEPVYRGDGAPEIRSLLPEGEPLDRHAPMLRWTPVPEGNPEGTVYDLTATTEALQPVAEVEGLSEPEFPLPAEALDELPSGARLLWRVEAHLTDGGTVRSPTFSTPVE